MERMPLGRDLRLSAVLAVVLAVLAAVYVVALAAPLWLTSVGVLPLHYALLADAILAVLFVAEYVALDTVTLRASRARLVSRGEAPWLHDTLGRLAALADLPTPRVALVDSPVPNAFATGRDPLRSTVVVTRGLLADLERGEVEAVLAHELAHIANRDGAVMTVASFPGLTLRQAIGSASAKMWILGLPLMLLACAGWAFTTGLMLMVSRCREYAADRSAALVTGAPEQLMSALQKIAGRVDAIPRSDLRRVASVSAFFILPIRAGAMTHPPIRRRLERLEQLGRELGRTAPAESVAVPPPVRANVRLGVATFVVTFAAIVLLGLARL